MASPCLRPLLTGAAVFTLLAAVSVAPLGAAPFVYSENASGDLGEQLPADAVFTFDVGLNAVDGYTEYLPFGQFSADFDSFAFEVPAGTRLAQVMYSFIESLNAGTTHAVTQFTIDSGNAFPGFPPLGSVNVDLLGANIILLLEGALPLPPDIYVVHNSGLSVGGPGESTPGWSAIYLWEFTVVTDPDVVPEPAVVPMLVSALAALGVHRRIQGRRKAF